MLKGKTVLLGVTGSIAAYKIAGLASMLKKQHADITVLMTQNATNFINPITFETLTGNKCLIDTFDRNFQYSVEHVALAKRADIVLIAPASANVIGKIANGIADDMLTTTVMACRCPILISPAMNTNMFLNPIVQDNLAKLRRFGYTVIEPDSGYLACGDIGAGKMPSEKTLFGWIMQTIGAEKDLAGQKILVTAGATAEKIDPVRFITNHSTGKMGCALARRAAMSGDARLREHDRGTASVCDGGESGICGRHVQRGDEPCAEDGRHHQSGCGGGLPPEDGRRGENQKARRRHEH